MENKTPMARQFDDIDKGVLTYLSAHGQTREHIIIGELGLVKGSARFRLEALAACGLVQCFVLGPKHTEWALRA